MKFIFDFDDVLFLTNRFREKVYEICERGGIPPKEVKSYMEEHVPKGFSLKKLLRHFSLDENLYPEIMHGNEEFMNEEVLVLVRKAGRENCYILTHGDEEFQMEKIRSSGIKPFFTDTIVVLGSKKAALEKLCEQYANEDVIFIDDKTKHFENLDFKKYPNLKTILYDERGLKKLMLEIKK